MKIDFVSNNFTGNLIVTVFNLEDIFEVEKNSGIYRKIPLQNFRL